MKISDIVNEDAVDEGRIKAALHRKAKHAGKASGRKHKYKLKIGEDATAGGTGAGDIGVVANPPAARQKIKTGKNGTPEAPQKKNKDGTAKNALELGNNLMGGSTIKR
jgi:hypothetical protein